ncbi:transcriptional regulator [Rhodococcoides trifolii]|uniref:Transcriptional regulator n=1 Tax=Rhodococcoides trifolii TaxID=908250 RepID=A0A917G6I8_9NOCA|nr:TetR/AcrR family transcriptional regulator [Rhodococcus trifolii]GGG25382.1 transcriptional regulator [Rhodococcus trifolii]
MARAGLTLERVALAGAELADRDGFDRVTVSAVARHFDVAVASLYSYVKSSRDLEGRIALLALTELADRAAEAIAGRSGKDALTAFADAYREYALAHPGRWAATRATLDPDSGALAAGRRHTDLMQAVLRGYHLDDRDRTHAIRLLGSVFNGYVSLESSGGFAHSTPDSQQSWVRILDALDALLRNWPQEGPT